MRTGVFYVQIRDDYEKLRKDFFPYISSEYMKIAKNFLPDKIYPVLAVKDVTIIAEDESNIETSQFLVPTENNNFMWVQSEIFQYAGIAPEK
jgi:hypothetical protein